MRKIITLSLLLLPGIILMAQDKKFKFGKIDKATLEMKNCSIDSTASAAILYDYGYFTGSTFIFERFMRIKIFTDEGKEWGNWSFPTGDKATLKGITYNLLGDEIVMDKLERSDIMVEDVINGDDVRKVAMPKVQAGSVIDIQLIYEGFPTEWDFQHGIPTLRSELSILLTLSISGFVRSSLAMFPWHIRMWITG